LELKSPWGLPICSSAHACHKSLHALLFYEKKWF
jgi:hypothetical protein